jgi:hypothetical protein
MSTDPLAQLLRAADSTAAVRGPASPTQFADQVRNRLARRRRNRSVATALAIVLTASLAATIASLPGLRPQPVQVAAHRPAEPPAATKLDLALQAELHERTAKRLLASGPSGTARRTVDPNSALAELRQQRDRAALMIVYAADAERRANRPQQAVAAYRRTIELFPQTHWAAVARQRLKEIGT